MQLQHGARQQLHNAQKAVNIACPNAWMKLDVHTEQGLSVVCAKASWAAFAAVREGQQMLAVGELQH